MKHFIPILLILSLLLSLASCSGNYGEVDLKKPVALSEDGAVEKELLDKIKAENAIPVARKSTSMAKLSGGVVLTRTAQRV